MKPILAPNGVSARREINARNYYEAAQTSNHRSIILGQVQDAKADITKHDRHEIIRKARDLYRNSGFVRGVIEKIITYVIGGTGIQPRANSGDAEWDRMANSAWNNWSRFANLQNRYSYATTQRLIYRARLLDGDIGSLHTHGPSGRPRIQTVESQRITHARDKSNLKRNQPEGVNLDSYGRPTSYSVRYLSDGEVKYREIDSEHMTLHWHPERSEQYRGVSLLASAINTAHDISDIVKLEKQAVKDHSRLSRTIKTQSGELEDDESVLRGGVENPTTEEDRQDYYRQVFGAETEVLRWGDSMDLHASNRPSPAWQGFMDFLCNTVCLSANIPPSIILPIKIGGADTRAVLSAGERVFQQEQAMLADEFQRHWEFVIGYEMEAGFLPEPDGDPYRTLWQMPKRLSADYGREAQQDREDVKTGLLSREDYWGRLGKNAEEQDRKVVDEAVRRKALISDAGISTEEFKFLVSMDGNGAVTAPVESGTGVIEINSDEIKAMFDAYGVGVRAGSITPTPADEVHFRAKAGLPAISPEASRSWDDEGKVRRPITLVMPGEEMLEPSPEDNDE